MADQCQNSTLSRVPGLTSLILTLVLRRQLGALLVVDIPLFVSSFSVSFDGSYNGSYTIAGISVSLLGFIVNLFLLFGVRDLTVFLVCSHAYSHDREIWLTSFMH